MMKNVGGMCMGLGRAIDMRLGGVLSSVSYSALLHAM